MIIVNIIGGSLGLVLFCLWLSACPVESECSWVVQGWVRVIGVLNSHVMAQGFPSARQQLWQMHLPYIPSVWGHDGVLPGALRKQRE